MEQGWPGLAQYVCAVPANWSPRPRTVQDALDQLAARAAASDAASFVFRPGGVPSLGVYTTWATLMAAVALLDPAEAKTIAIDNSLAAAHATAAAVPWNVENCTFTSGGAGTTTAQLFIDDGCHFTWEHLYFDVCTVELDCNTPVLTLSGVGVTALVTFRNGSFINQNLGTSRFVAVGPNAALVCLVENVSIIESGLSGTFAMTDATARIEMILLGGSVLQPNAVVGGLGALTILADGASQGSSGVSTTQTVGTVTVSVADPIAVFVFRPAGTAGGNVFTTWASLMAAVALSPGQRTIVVDNSLGAAHATTGTWNVDNCLFMGSANATLLVDVGSVWQAPSGFEVKTITISSAATAPVMVVTLGTVFVTLRDGATLQSTTATAFFQASATMALSASEQCVLGDGVHPVITTDAGQTSVVDVFNFTSVSAHAYAGLGTTVSRRDANSPVSATQDVTTNTITLIDNAASVTYGPAVAGNWNPAPTTAKAGLDQLAASNTTQAAGNTGTTTATVTVTTGNITKAKNGTMQVGASCAFVTSGATTVTLQLVRDAATNIGTPKSLVFAGAAAADMSIAFNDTAPDALAHTYKLSTTASGGATLSVSANSAQINVVEDS